MLKHVHDVRIYTQVSEPVIFPVSAPLKYLKAQLYTPACAD